MSAVKPVEPDRTTELSSARIKDVMATEIIAVYEGWSVKRLADFFVDKQIAGAPVVAADGQLVGVVTVTDILKFDSAAADTKTIQVTVNHYCNIAAGTLTEEDIKQLNSRASTICTVNSIMTKDVIHVEEDIPIFQAAALMLKNDIHRLFVTQDNKVVGVVTSMDLLKPMANLAV
ncbi:MAG: CBS domain-containing protein [Pseudomonadales bacterium]|nr:CBS domain-containing protein [Pseudomonadales bacterium]